MKKLLLATIALIFASSSAWAQNPVCPTRPFGDSTNACASTAFVQGAAGGSIPFLNLRFTQTGTGAVSETLDGMYRNNIFYPEMFADTPNSAVCGIADAGPAIQRAINASGALSVGPGTVQLQSCAYTVITPIIDSFGVRLLGSSVGGTSFVFQPTGAGQIAYRVRNAGHIISNGGLENITFYTNDTAFVKVAIEVEDVSHYAFKNVKVSGNTTGLASLWGDVSGASIGLRTRGREFIRPDGLELNANRPLEIAKNPNSTIDLDVSDFRNVNVVASNGNNGITINDGLALSRNNFTNVHISGGTNCLYWINSTGTLPSDSNTFENFGCEQPGTGATGYNYVIEGNATGTIRNLTLSGFHSLDNARNGPIFRNIQNLNISGTIFYQGVAPLFCMDVDNTVHGMSWRNSLFQSCSITAFLGQKKIIGADINAGQVLPNWANYASTLDAGTLTWPFTQTFTVAPVFTDAPGTRTALGLGTIATQSAAAVAITGGTLSGMTSIASPLYYGGASAGSTLSLNGTSNGSPSSAFLLLQPGTTQFVGINNAAPKTTLDINANTVTSPTLVVATSVLRVQSANAADGGMEWVSYGGANGNYLTGAVANGTAASPTATPAARNMFNLSGWGWNGSAWAKGAIIAMQTPSLWSGSNQATQIDFYTTPGSSTTIALAASILPTGGLLVGSGSGPGAGQVAAQNGFIANNIAGISKVCTIAVGQVLTFTLGILTATSGTAGCV